MIRPAKREDLEPMLLLLQQLFGIEADFCFDAERQRKGLELLLDSPSSAIMVAKKQDSVIAMGTAQLVISTAEGRPSLLIEDVVVKPSWQKQGIGSQLLQTLADWGADKGAKRMQLLADRTNAPALDFYHRDGWQQTQLICLRKFHSERNRT
ncbi:MAG: GNAT family N-acetyltransferase [Desulforhopalus sp.]|nr:GNAT family N-acetyltransferase [Desulforhopalus sp.]